MLLVLFSSVAILTCEKENEKHNFVAGRGSFVIRLFEDEKNNW
jgi:hypothetical protein